MYKSILYIINVCFFYYCILSMFIFNWIHKLGWSKTITLFLTDFHRRIAQFVLVLVHLSFSGYGNFCFRGATETLNYWWTEFLNTVTMYIPQALCIVNQICKCPAYTFLFHFFCHHNWNVGTQMCSCIQMLSIKKNLIS